MTRGIENKEKFLEAYDEIQPLLSGKIVNRNKEISLDNPFYLKNTYLKK